jgi:Protein of unknown function (DUF2786)
MSESERPSEVWIAKIRKILSKTEDAGCTQEEAEAAFALATRLMAEYNLEMSDIEVKDDSQKVEWGDEEILQTGRWFYENNLAYGIVKEYAFIDGFFTHRCDGFKTRKVLRFFGKKENVETARFMFNALLAAYDRLWITYRYLTQRPASDRRIYVAGIAMGFRDQLRAERQAMEIERDIVKGKSSGSTALALVSVMDETTSEYKKAHPECKDKRGHYAGLSGTDGTLNDGYKAGKALNLNRAIGGAGMKRLGS